MAAARRCPKCGKSLPAEVAQGTCPACLLRAGFVPDTEPPPTDGPAEVASVFAPTHTGHVLESLEQSIGRVHSLLLDDTALDDAGMAVIKPSSDAMPATGDRGDRYQLFGEIARGGFAVTDFVCAVILCKVLVFSEVQVLTRQLGRSSR
jgi:hypothetical protein